jgi:hypothetical protein
MLQLIVAGKLSFSFFGLLLISTHAQSAAEGGRSSAADFFFASVLQRPNVKLQERRSQLTPGVGIPRIGVS